MRRIAAEAFAMLPVTGSLRACLSFVVHGRQHVSKGNSGETSGVVSQAIRDDQHTLMEESAASIDDVRYVTFPFVFVGTQQRLAKAADHFTGIVAIQQERSDAILAHRADPVAEHQPAGTG